VKVPTKFVSPLNDKQIQELNTFIKNNLSQQIWIRANSILLSSKVLSIDKISQIYNVHRDSVSCWINAWNKSGIKGLEDLPRSGRPPNLTESEKEIAIKLIKEQPRSLKIVQNRLTQQTGKTASISTLKRIAKASKLTWKRARKSLEHKKCHR